jgi:phage repressor protein C with HTH and peptisase S24 domain
MNTPRIKTEATEAPPADGSSMASGAAARSPLAQRIEARLAEIGQTMTAASLAAGDNKDLLRDIISGKVRNPRTDTVRRVADVLGVTVAWLTDGDGDMPPPLVGRPSANARAASIPPPERTARRLPVMGTAAGSLGGAFQIEAGPVDYVACPPALVGAGGIYALYVEGASMEPRHGHGDLIFVHPGRKPNIGDSVVVTARYSDGGALESFIKRLVRRSGDKLVVEQINPRATIEFDMRFVASIHKVLTTNELFGV